MKWKSDGNMSEEGTRQRKEITRGKGLEKEICLVC